MSSEKRILSSRANGALSHGPVTAEGKQRSSLNSIRHGLLAKCVVLPTEDRSGFDILMQQHIQFYNPINDVERGVIEDMVASLWRLRRTWAIETQLQADAIDAQPPGDEVRRMAAAFTILASTPQLAILHRHETRLHNMRQRAMKNIHLLRTTPPSPNLPDSDPPSFDAEPVPDTPPDPDPTPEELAPQTPRDEPTLAPAPPATPATLPTPEDLAPQDPRDEPTFAPAPPATPATPPTPEDFASQEPRDEPTLAPAEPDPPEDPEKDEDPDDDEEYDDDEDDPIPTKRLYLVISGGPNSKYEYVSLADIEAEEDEEDDEDEDDEEEDLPDPPDPIPPAQETTDPGDTPD